MTAQGETSHREALKSTGIIGGEQAVVIVSGILRAKVISVLLGPLGMGISSLYQSTIDFVKYGTGLGIGFSAVRDIGEAAATNDENRIARSIFILRRWIWATGALGMLVVLLFCRTMSRYAFGDEKHAWQFALLSVTLLISAVSSGQLAILQGLRKLVYLAKGTIFGTVLGLTVSIPLYWFFKDDGIVLALVAVSLGALYFSWYFARHVVLPPVHMTSHEVFRGGLGMAQLGFFIVLTSFLSTGTMYAVRLVIIRKMNLDGVGQFQAAWTVSSVYLVAILNAMAADYFPRLSGVSQDNAKMNVLINEQAEVALLVAGPLIVGMISFSWLLLKILYTSKFTASIPIMQWQILGTLIKVALWPVGFVFFAKKKVVAIVLSELLWNGLYLTMIWFGWARFGIVITGISFFCSFVVSSLMIWLMVRKMTGFRWSPMNLTLLGTFGGLSLASFLLAMNGKGVIVSALEGALFLVGAFVSYRHLKKIVDFRQVIQRVLRR